MRQALLKSLMLSIGWMGFFCTCAAQHQLHFNNSNQVPDPIVCPGQKTILPKPKLTKPSEEPVLEIPDLEEIGNAFASTPTNSYIPADLAPLRLPAYAKQPIRIGFWGDSHAAANFFTDELIKSIGLSKDEVLPSFIAANIGRAGVRLPLKKTCLGGGWKYSYAYNTSVIVANTRTLENDFSMGFIKLQATHPNSYLWLDFRSTNDSVAKIQSLDLLVDPSFTAKQTKLAISVDDFSQEIMLDSMHTSRITIDADYPFSTLKIRLIQGGLSLHGIIPHYTSSPKLYLDNLAIPGATAKAWTTLNRSKDFIPPYDLIFLEYGTNEGNHPNFDLLSYQSDLSIGLQNFRAMYPDAACVLIGPTDRGVLIRSSKKAKKLKSAPDLFHFSTIHAQIANVQAQEASRARCSFWDWQKAMGGPGSAYLWAYEKPPLISRDLIHLTIQGYQKSARQLSSDFDLKALLNP